MAVSFLSSNLVTIEISVAGFEMGWLKKAMKLISVWLNDI